MTKAGPHRQDPASLLPWNRVRYFELAHRSSWLVPVDQIRTPDDRAEGPTLSVHANGWDREVWVWSGCALFGTRSFGR
jgi:hypothetical protein